MTFEEMKAHYYNVKDHDFFEKCNIKSDVKITKAWGDFSETVPSLTILVNTYKRPKWLEETLNSILSQEGFEDYEIIVMDNEGESIYQKTETHSLIERIGNSKIIYFRNERTVPGTASIIAGLARTKWICYCHDDDLLAPGHLGLMMKVISEHPEILFLSCSHTAFSSTDELCTLEKKAKDSEAGITCRAVSLKEDIFIQRNEWHGAIIDREKYCEMGGMGRKTLGMGDVVMPARFTYLYGGRYYLNVPLYYYRVSDNQLSAKPSSWQMVYISEYCYYLYASKKVFPGHSRIMSYISQWKIFEKMRASAANAWNLQVDGKEIAASMELEYFDPCNSMKGRLFGVIWSLWNIYLYRFVIRKSERAAFLVQTKVKYK